MLPVAPVTRNVSMLDFVSFIWCEVGIHLTQLNLTRCVCRGRFSDRRTIISYVAVAAFTACCTNLPHPARSPSFPARRGLARLSMVIGVEREIQQKSAGLRTHTLVGVGAALFMLISKYGFNDVLEPGRIVLDPSRVAAQIVSGVGFLGAGLIFVRRDSVRGLTTAGAVWVTAAIGAACGAGLIVLGVAATGIYLIVATVFPKLSRQLPHSSSVISVLRVRYPDGKGVLREVLALATTRGFAISEISTEALGYQRTPGNEKGQSTEEVPMVSVSLHVRGQTLINDLVAALTELPGVDAVLADDANFDAE